MHTNPAPNLLSWASDIDPGTIQQAARTARLPILAGPVALMPDAHVGFGATVGSVVATDAAVIPSAVGVDIGCGMIAVETDLAAGQLPDDLGPLMPRIERTVPAGVGVGHNDATRAAERFFAERKPSGNVTGDLLGRAMRQFGSLGSGNHFFEVCLDERDRVWVVLHSGSRGVGNKLGTMHIERAKQLARLHEVKLEDPDLAWLVEGTAEFEAYITDMLWCQDYARANREAMMTAALVELFAFVGHGSETDRVNCHHNFCEREWHGDRLPVWVTRKGAIRAGRRDRGVIPGSMGTRSYVVQGKGSALSWQSCSHGAGRRHSRGAAKRLFTADDLREQMAGRTWQESNADKLIDEIPSAYKDIDQVMADQQDLVTVLHELRQVLNYKGN